MMIVSALSLMMLFTAGCAPQEDNWETIRSVAETNHEIIMLMIEKGQFEEIPKVAEKIFELEFPESHQNLLVREAQILTDALLHHGKPAIAHQVLDIAIKCVQSDRIKARLLREKAYLCKKEGNSDEAFRFFEESLELESKDGQPQD